MKIVQGPSAFAPTRRRGVDAAPDGGGFASHAQSEPDATSPSPTAPLTALDSPLAVQEVEHGVGERGQAVDRGHQLLDEIHELHLALVDGFLSEDNLYRLASLVDQAKPEIDDCEVASVPEDVELHAAVELARRQRRTS